MSKKPVEQVKRWVQSTNHTIKRSLSTSNTSVPNARYAGGGLNKQWVHPPDVLQFGRVEYTVKFLGECQVAQPKGTEVIKEAIHKIRFTLSQKRSQSGISGAKLPKVELQLNVDGLSIVECKSKMILHKYPLHRISFCADDKQDKRVFSFIAKNSDNDGHRCFVFLSDKLAEEITLTIGEAFDLAYRKFVQNNGKDLELKKQTILLRKRVHELEQENAQLKHQLYGGDAPANANHRLQSWENFESPPALPNTPIPKAPPSGVLAAGRLPLPSPPRKTSTEALMNDIAVNGPQVGRKLENLQLDDMDDLFDDEFNPRAGESKPSSDGPKDPFGLEPFVAVTNGEQKRDGEQPSAQELENAIFMIDSRLAEMREGFSRGLAFGDGSDLLDDFDPLAASTSSELNGNK